MTVFWVFTAGTFLGFALLCTFKHFLKVFSTNLFTGLHYGLPRMTIRVFSFTRFFFFFFIFLGCSMASSSSHAYGSSSSSSSNKEMLEVMCR
jgi:hypothetical protein